MTIKKNNGALTNPIYLHLFFLFYFAVMLSQNVSAQIGRVYAANGLSIHTSTGFIIRNEELGPIVITVNHGTRGCKDFTLGSMMKVDICYSSEEHDVTIGIFNLDTYKDFVDLVAKSSNNTFSHTVDPEDTFLTVGCPNGIAMPREFGASFLQIFDKEYLFRMITQKGQSGSPIMDEDGGVVAMVLRADQHFTRCYAIPAYKIEEVIKDAKDKVLQMREKHRTEHKNNSRDAKRNKT